jgi:hypothetical protein
MEMEMWRFSAYTLLDHSDGQGEFVSKPAGS